MQLKEISLELKPDMEKIFRTENSSSADYCYGNIFMWDKRYKQKSAIAGDRLITHIGGMGDEYFSFPVGSGDIVPAFDEMRAAEFNQMMAVGLAQAKTDDSFDMDEVFEELEAGPED